MIKFIFTHLIAAIIAIGSYNYFTELKPIAEVDECIDFTIQDFTYHAVITVNNLKYKVTHFTILQLVKGEILYANGHFTFAQLRDFNAKKVECRDLLSNE